MKKKYLQALSLFLTVTMLTGCGTNSKTMTFSNNEYEETTNTVDMKEEEKKNNSESSNNENEEYVQQLKSKFGKNDPKYDYQEPMYNLPLDHQFVFENVCDEAYEEGFFDSIMVYCDAELEHWIYVDTEEDYDNKKVALKPGSVFYCEPDSENWSIDNGTWGSRSKFYLVQYKDLTTNETYEKPHVTVFTIARELDTPTLKQVVNEEGDYQLIWNAVNGADYYEVYSYEEESDYARLMCTTKENMCTEQDFIEYINVPELEDEPGVVSSQNMVLSEDDIFFVMAKSDSGKVSGMSNICDISEIAHSIPRWPISTDYQSEGTSAMVLPSHYDVEMLDGNKTKMLLDYENADVHVEDGYIFINPKFVNARLNTVELYFEGMEVEAFKEDLKNVVARQKELEKKTAKQATDIDIPYVPSSEEQKSDTEVKESEEKKTEEKETESEKKEKTEEKETESEKKEKTEEKETESEKKEKTEEKEKDSKEKETKKIDSDLEDTVYANSSLSAHIALNMLENKERIYLDGFPESSDRDFLLECVLEAYNQNPLIGIMDSVGYDYEENCLVVSYILDKEENAIKRDAALEKAQEITDKIITEDMSDFEKEDAINTYLCENASYDESIFDYINEDGTISEEVAYEKADAFLPYGVLVNNLGVCESYAESFLLLARNAGLDAVIETGSLDGINHEWNRVKLDGDWYIMDVTNNDDDNLPNAYFNLSDEVSKEILIPDKNAICREAYSEYIASSDEKEYYLVKGKCASNQDEAVEMMGNLLEIDEKAAIRVNKELNESDVERIVKRIAKQLDLRDGKYYYNRGVLSVTKE